MKDTIDWLLESDPKRRPTAEDVAERVALVRGATYQPMSGAQAARRRRRSSRASETPRKPPPADNVEAKQPTNARGDKKQVKDASALFSMLDGNEEQNTSTTTTPATSFDAFGFDNNSSTLNSSEPFNSSAAFDFDPFGDGTSSNTATGTGNSADFGDFGAFQAAPTTNQPQSPSFAQFGNDDDFGSFQSASNTTAGFQSNTTSNNGGGFGQFQSFQHSQPMQQNPQFQQQSQSQFGGNHQFQSNQSSFAPKPSWQSSSSNQPPRQQSAPASTTSNAKNLLSMLESKGKGTPTDLLGSSTASNSDASRRTSVPMSSLSSSTSSMTRQQSSQQGMRNSAPGMSFDEFSALTSSPSTLNSSEGATNTNSWL